MKTLSDMLARLSPERRARVEAETQKLIERERKRAYFTAGEIVTCENGHEIADIVQDAAIHDMPKVAQFTNWRNVERAPEKGDKPQDMRCTVCGSRICLASGMGSFILHIGHGWRTNDPSRWGLTAEECSEAY